jgi:sigma-B regulation protein RsbU (phosphoserine phosphatase)
MIDQLVQQQLQSRRHHLQAALAARASRQLEALLAEVDAALGRVAAGTYGLCETCHDPIEADRLAADPLTRVCLDHLTPSQQEQLERDLHLASQIQRRLLPPADLRVHGWEFAYSYVPAGVVSGDYCDVVPAGADGFFLLGDVAGKGIAASMLMTQLHGVFRSLIPLGLGAGELLQRAGSIFGDSTLPSHYATMACARVGSAGRVEICNAGHPPVVVVGATGHVTRHDSSGLPLGMFLAVDYPATQTVLVPGDTIVLFSDGLSEAEDDGGAEFGIDRLADLLGELAPRPPFAVVEECLRAIRAFRGPAVQHDDMTVLVIQRQHEAGRAS